LGIGNHASALGAGLGLAQAALGQIGAGLSVGRVLAEGHETHGHLREVAVLVGFAAEGFDLAVGDTGHVSFLVASSSVLLMIR
jgi:hypothetical protein